MPLLTSVEGAYFVIRVFRNYEGCPLKGLLAFGVVC